MFFVGVCLLALVAFYPYIITRGVEDGLDIIKTSLVLECERIDSVLDGAVHTYGLVERGIFVFFIRAAILRRELCLGG